MDQRLLISLDCFLDSRLAMIDKLDKHIATKIVSNPLTMKQYRNRMNDDFTKFGVDDAKYKEEWKKRTADILPRSILTPFTHVLTNIIKQVEVDSILKPHEYESFEIHINVHPYDDLTEEEREFILDSISTRLNHKVKLKTVSYSDKILTPDFIKARDYTALFFYDFNDWFNETYSEKHDLAEINKRRMMGVTIYSTYQPVSADSLKAAFNFKSPSGEQIPPHMGLEAILREFFELEFLGMEYFCIIDPELHLSFSVSHAEINL